MQTADLIFVSVSGLMFDVYNNTVAYCNRLSVKMAGNNSSKAEFKTCMVLWGLTYSNWPQNVERSGYLIYLCRSIMQKVVLGSFDNVNFKFVFLRAQTLQW